MPYFGVLTVLVLTGLGDARTSGSPAQKPEPRARGKATPSTDAGAERVLPAQPISRNVRGRAVLPDGTGIRGLQVSIGEKRELTGRGGWFEFADVPDTYDLSLAEGGGQFITAYFGLRRRDPIVTHTARKESPPRKVEYHADIEGAVDVASIVSAEQVAPPVVYFLSPSTVANGSLAGYRQNHGKYRVSVGWGGAALNSGVLIALASAEGRAYLAKRSLTIGDGEHLPSNRADDKIRPDLELQPVAMGQIAGSAQIFTRKIGFVHSEGEEREILKVGYAVPHTMGLINLGECESKAGAFVCRVPDLTDLGGEYCISVVAITDPRINDHMPGPHRQVDIRANCCGGTFGMKDFQIQRVPMPDTGDGHFNLGPDTTRKFTKDTLTWTGPEEPLQQLNLGSCAYGSCLVAYLDKSSFSWADLETTGMTYLRGFPLLASVSAYYPPVSVDALAAGVGRFSDRVTWQRADSRVVDMGLADPPKRAPSASSPKSPDVQDLAKLPTCSGMIQAHSFGQLNPAMDDKSIRVRGILAPNLQDCIVLDRGYAYGRERPCGFATWALADPENLDNKMPLRRQGAPLRTGVSDRAPDARPVEVIASGTLRARAPRAPDFGDTRDEYSLDEVALCAVRPPSPPAGE